MRKMVILDKICAHRELVLYPFGRAFDPLHIHCTWGNSPLHVSVQGGGSKIVTFVERRVLRGTSPSNVS